MSFGGFHDRPAQQPMSEINVTPMVDVMLVLLVIFIITAPLFASSIKLQLPNAKGTATESRSESITLSIQADGALFWNDTALALPALQARLTALAAQAPDTQIRLRVDKAAQFDVVAKVLSMAQGSGLTRVGFVTEPVGGG